MYNGYNPEEHISNISILKSESVLITGATGLIGSGIVDFLLYLNKELNYQIKIIATGRNKNKLKKRFYKDINSEFLILETLDLENNMKSFFEEKRPTYVIHAASGADPKSFDNNPVDIMMSNFIGCNNLLKGCLSTNVKNFLYISSGEVYGKLDSKYMPFEENMVGYLDFNDVRSCYPESKRATETLCNSFCKQYNQTITIARPSHIFGPNFTNGDSRVSADFFRKAINNEKIEIHSSGLQYRTYTYIFDCVTALLTILVNGKSREAYNVTNTSNGITLRDFGEKIAYHSGVDFVVKNDSKNDRGNMINAAYSNVKLKKLGWTPIVDIELGIETTLKILKGE